MYAKAVLLRLQASIGRQFVKPYYIQDGITIYCGDCHDLLPVVAPPETVALLVADPPYGMALDTDNTGTQQAGASFADGRRMPGRKWDAVHGDDKPFDPAHLLAYPRLVIFGANHFASRLPESNRWIVWNKRGDGKPSTMHFGDCELAWSNVGTGVRMFSNVWHGTARWRGAQGEPMLHPTQKPTVLMRWLVESYSEPGDLIADPYMGSGPLAQACRDTGRRYVGIEIDERYCAAAVSRFDQQTFDLGEAA